ncbi:MAG: hypothetical protein J2P19_18235 [Pseudonocardia sp.]|nr:hypothetical protein [Pseudonocardia sp.]
MDPDALLEIKHSASYDGWGDEGTDEIPVYYRAQVLWQMDAFGLDTAYVACLFLASHTIREYVLTMDEDAREGPGRHGRRCRELPAPARQRRRAAGRPLRGNHGRSPGAEPDGGGPGRLR